MILRSKARAIRRNKDGFAYAYHIRRRKKGRRLVMTDMHGCRATFETLCARVGLRKRDQLFLLGDYINKGPDSRGVLDFVMNLQAKGYRVFPLLGNHDQMLLNALDDPKQDVVKVLEANGSADLLDSKGKIAKHYLGFLRALPWYYELDHYLLVHAGFDFSQPDPFDQGTAMLEIRDFKIDPLKIGDRQIIHGHNPTGLKEIQARIKASDPILRLDNGCVYEGDGKGDGNLLCLDLGTMALTRQENIESVSVF